MTWFYLRSDLLKNAKRLFTLSVDPHSGTSESPHSKRVFLIFFCSFTVKAGGGAASNPAWHCYQQQKQRGQRADVRTWKLPHTSWNTNKTRQEQEGVSFVASLLMRAAPLWEDFQPLLVKIHKFIFYYRGWENEPKQKKVCSAATDVLWMHERKACKHPRHAPRCSSNWLEEGPPPPTPPPIICLITEPTQPLIGKL